MNRSKRAALLTLLCRELKKRGSWCGETHLQKATYFLQEMLGVETDFNFILYRHGPFSFDLRDELSSMQADNLFELAIRAQGYGPTYIPTEFSDVFLERFPKTIARHIDRIEFLAEELKDKGVAELERLSTAFYIANQERITDVADRARRLVELKPHISFNDALVASGNIDAVIERSVPFIQDEAQAS
jgi:hypothetical protein